MVTRREKPHEKGNAITAVYHTVGGAEPFQSIWAECAEPGEFAQGLRSGSLRSIRPFWSFPGSRLWRPLSGLVAISSRRKMPTRSMPTEGAARRKVSQPD